MLCHKINIFLRAERRRREAGREKFTHEQALTGSDFSASGRVGYGSELKSRFVEYPRVG